MAHSSTKGALAPWPAQCCWSVADHTSMPTYLAAKLQCLLACTSFAASARTAAWGSVGTGIKHAWFAELVLLVQILDKEAESMEWQAKAAVRLSTAKEAQSNASTALQASCTSLAEQCSPLEAWADSQQLLLEQQAVQEQLQLQPAPQQQLKPKRKRAAAAAGKQSAETVPPLLEELEVAADWCAVCWLTALAAAC